MNKWVTIWSNAMSIVENKPEGYSKDITLRYAIVSAMDGEEIQLSFDNYAGREEVELTKVTAMIKREGLKIAFQPIFFSGNESVVMKSAEGVKSDVIKMPIKKGDVLYVSIYLGQFTSMRSGVLTTGPLSNGMYATGDETESVTFPSFSSKIISWVYFLNQVDILGSQKNRSIIAFGDSITSQSWPEYLQLTCLHENKNVGIVRRAVSGSRVLRQYENLIYQGYGISGLNRFNHDIESVQGADTVVILQGINDFIHPVGIETNEFRPWSDLPTSQEIIEGYQAFIQEAKNHGLKVIFGTLLPVKGWRTYQNFRNELRNEVNQWIRETSEIDDFIDFDKELRNPEDPAILSKEYDSGDHLHPSELGYQKMAELAYKKLID